MTRSRAELELLMWQAGDLSYLVKPHALPLYNFLRRADSPTLVGMVSRQFGKSYVAVVVATEAALLNPGHVITVTSKDTISLKAFLVPNMRKILAHKPRGLEIKFNQTDHTFTLPNSAVIRLTGADTMRRVDANRGPAVNLWMVDESCFIPSDEFKSLVQDVIRPTFLTTAGRLVVLSSAPKEPAHHFTEMRSKAILDGGYFAASIDDMPQVTPKERAKWAAEAGGEASDVWRREYLNQLVIDATRVIVAEFVADEARFTKPVRPPDQLEKCLVSADPGFSPDPMGAVFGYYDFKRAKLCIQAEIVCMKQNTARQAHEIATMERRLWAELNEEDVRKGREHVRPWRRTSDSANPQWAFDMQTLHHLLFLPVVKESLEGMVNQLRIRFQKGEIEIDPSCKQLLHQLRTGVWNKTRTKFEHQAESHLDLLAALVYLVRSVPVGLNPYPTLPEDFDPGQDIIRPDIIEAQAFASESGNAQALRAIIPGAFNSFNG